MATYLGEDDVFDEALAELRQCLRRPERAGYESLAQAADSGRVIAHRGI